MLDEHPLAFESLPGYSAEDDSPRAQTLQKIMRANCGPQYQERTFRLVEMPLELLSHWYEHGMGEESVEGGGSMREYIKHQAEQPGDRDEWARGLKSIDYHMARFTADEDVTPIIVDFFHDRDRPFILDGWHRTVAAHESGQETILVYELLPRFTCESFPDGTTCKTGDVDGILGYTSRVGDKQWYSTEEYNNEKLHRGGGLPAVELVDGTRLWYVHGKAHREDGPAIEIPAGAGSLYLYRLPVERLPSLQEDIALYFLRGKQVEAEEVLGSKALAA